MSGYNEFIPKELDIFSNKPVILCINDSTVQEYTPLNTVDNANSLEFLSLPFNDKYKDLSWVFLKLQVQILKGDGEKFATGDANQPHLISNGLHSIFKSAFVTLNSTSLRNVEQNYHYKVITLISPLYIFMCFL